MHETYLDVLNVRKFRCALARLRTSSHDLGIERGRYENIPRHERICKLCGSGVENEIHFVLLCPSLSQLRTKYIPPKYYNRVCTQSFIILLSNRNENVIKNLAMYVYYGFIERKRILSSAN